MYSQTHWRVREETITIEYGTPYEIRLGKLVDTNKYSFITYDNTTTTSNMQNEENKDYASVGKYEIVIKHSDKIKILGLPKKVASEKIVNVTIKDTTNPKITPPEKIEILVGSKLNIKSYSYLFQVEDFSKTSDIDFDTSQINTEVIGEYKLIASVKDSYGNEAQCEVPVFVINDPYEEEPITEPTVEEETQNVPVSNNKPAVPQNQNTSKETTTKNKEYKNKDFLFSDGYTMSTVSDAAYKYLKESGRSGECVPLKDDEGIYIGMRVVFH